MEVVKAQVLGSPNSKSCQGATLGGPLHLEQRELMRLRPMAGIISHQGLARSWHLAVDR